jgi:hypothetical protein
VLTKAEIERVALLLAGDAYVNAPPPIALPFEPTSVHEPLLQCVVEFMLHVYRQEGKTRFEDNATLLRVELLTAASRLGYAAQVVPVAAWLGRRLRDLVAPLATCGIDASFYLTDVKRFVILELRAGTLPDLDGRDPGLPPAAPRPVIHKPARSNGLESPDGTNGKQAEPDWGSLEQNGESDQ